MTTTTQMLLAVLLEHPGAEHFGLDLSGKAALAPGTVYQILHRLEAVEWVESWWESDVEAAREGRPARRYYRLTRYGATRAPDRLAACTTLIEDVRRVLRASGPLGATS